MNKQSYVRPITGLVAALVCMAAIAGCRGSSTSQAQSDVNSQVPPCVATKTCPGYPSTVSNRPAAPPAKLPGQP
jgi:hypothetical protein